MTVDVSDHIYPKRTKDYWLKKSISQLFVQFGALKIDRSCLCGTFEKEVGLYTCVCLLQNEFSLVQVAVVTSEIAAGSTHAYPWPYLIFSSYINHKSNWSRRGRSDQFNSASIYSSCL